MTSSQAIELWLSMPNEWSPISAFSDNRMACINEGSSNEFWNQMADRSHFCCWHDGFEAALGGISVTAGGVAMIALFIPDLISKGAAAVAETISLASGAIGSISGAVASVLCQENPPHDFMEWVSQNKGNWASLLGSLLNIASEAKVFGKVVSVIGSYIDAYGVSNSLYSRDEAHKSSLCTEDPPTGGESDPVNSLDPNDIHGYLSESGSHYMRREIQSVQYEIEFENDTTLATAAAHTIIVRDTLDATKFDLNSLAARSVTIGDKRLELNGEQTFACTLDLRPEIYVIAQIEQEYDASTGIVQWTIESLDPMTMEPTDNPNQGALPINYNGEGIATFTFNIDLKEPFPDGTEISNRVGIIFDLEEPVITDTWTNIVDAVKPTSQIEEVTPVADSLSFSFVSEDNRSGVWYHTLYYRNDSTYQEWQVKKAQIFEDNFMLKLDDLLTTEFLVMAVDSAGNREDKLMNAEYVFSLDSVVYYTLAVESQGCGEVSGVGTYLAGSHVVIEAVPDVGCQFVQWNDGLTDNPRTVELVQDTTFVAQFSSDHSDITQTTDLTSGWNWWSSYVELDGASSLQSLENGLGINGEMIKSQDNGYASYLEGYGWYGSLSSISNESTYQVKSNEACSVEMTGSTANPEEHPITLNSGWTWVGYPVNASMSVEDALANITPQNGDMLKSQNDGYASYLDGFGWYGSLNTLNPGMGLMYKSNNGNSVTLLYPTSGTRTDLKTNQTTENNHWQPNLNAYADNMSVMAVVELDGEELASERYELAAFANGEVRGSARLMYVDPIDRYMAFLTIAGDEASELRFGLYDAETGDVETQSFASLQYETNAVVGSFVEPYVVSLRGTTGLDEWFGGLNVFPNPVERGEIVTLVLPEAGTLRATSVEIIDALGTEVETLHAPSVQAITAPKVAGVYTLRITVEGKGTCFRKLVVR